MAVGLRAGVRSGRESARRPAGGRGTVEGRGGGSANNTALIIPWTSARMFLCLL